MSMLVQSPVPFEDFHITSKLDNNALLNDISTIQTNDKESRLTLKH